MVKVKKQYQATVIAFGSSGLPLGQRDDLDELAVIALRSSDPSLLQLFEQLPTLETLLKQKTDRQLGRLPVNPPKDTDNGEVPGNEISPAGPEPAAAEPRSEGASASTPRK